MNQENSQIAIDEEIIISKIYNVRGKQVILSYDLAELYQQVKRNIGRFPERYMFQLTQNEYDRLRSHFVIFKRGQHLKYMPYAFTEHGLLMLSSVLKSSRAEKVNMLIIDTFVKIRELIFLNKDLILQLEQVRNRLTRHDNQITVILEYLSQIEKAKEKELEQKKRPRIGFKP
jgi:hypothetical protein